MPSTDGAKPSPLSKLRRNKGTANASSNSLASGSGDGEASSESQDGSSGLRASIEKVKQRTRRSIDDRRGSADTGSKRLSSLLPQRKRSAKPDDTDQLERRLSALSGDSGSGNLSNMAMSGNRSDTSLFDDSGRSSLLTDDNSDIEAKPVRPTLSPHHSHAGYLTLSSPELNARTQSVASIDDITSTSEAFRSTASIPHIVEPTDTEPFPSITTSNRTPSPSPGNKIRDAFKLPRKQQPAETDSLKSGVSGTGGFGGLFRPKSRRGSLTSQLSQEPPKAESPAVTPDPDVSIPEAQSQQQLLQSVLDPSQAPGPLDGSEGRPETPKRQTRGRSRINTESLPSTPPNLVDTPTTLVTPPTPTDPTGASTFPDRRAVTSNPSEASPPPPTRPLSSVESIRHRRAQSAKLPSKLSNAIPAPLTPPVEETKTPGGTLTQPTSATGFFSSFITAATKAADQLSQNINTANAQNKSKSTVSQLGREQGEEEVIPGADFITGAAAGDTRQPAVDTLGKGDLSLSQLGISESQNPSPMTSAVDLPQQGKSAQNGTGSQKTEEEAAARAVSMAYEKPVQNVISQATGRPLSVASNDHLTLNGDQSPPRSGENTDAGIKRSGSVRSKISGRTRRHRASSATTGTTNTIAMGLQSTVSALTNPGANGVGHRLTGFAVASSKRNKDFHQLFRSVPEDDYLIEDYSAALQRDILLHGRLYVSEGHICFSSNILGWVTNLVISFDEIASVEKKSTAMIFPNAIVIQTLQARSTFASFVARDSTYELIIGIWKISHPNLKSSLNGVALADAGTGDKTEVADPEASDEETADGLDDEVYDEDEDDDVGSFTDGGMAPSVAASETGEIPLSRKTSAQPVNGAPLPNGVQAKAIEITAETAAVGASASVDFPGPPTHAATECGDASDHYDRPLTDTIIPAPLGKVYSMLFGPASGPFMRKWLVEDQKSRELNLAEDKIGLDNEHKSMVFDYIKPLNAPVGPRQTKCITTNNVISYDLEKAVTIDCSTQTPDVPSGNVFTTKTRVCFMWAPGNATRIVANCTIEWTGKSWLKGPIEKGATDGQTEYFKSLVAAIRAAVTTKPVIKVPTLKKGKRRSKKEASEADAALAQRDAVVAVAEQKAANWGIFEPLHALLDPLLSIVRPFIKSEVIIAVLFVMLAYSWFASPSRGGGGVGFPGYNNPQRLAAYDEMWRREESELWDWLEDRVGLDHLYAPSAEYRDKQKVLASRSMGKKLENERMSERRIDDAIKMTEERLDALKDAVAKEKGKKKGKTRPVEKPEM